jgi:hypothetical protein
MMKHIQFPLEHFFNPKTRNTPQNTLTNIRVSDGIPSLDLFLIPSRRLLDLSVILLLLQYQLFIFMVGMRSVIVL